jgi:flagellar biosynthesis/type III secretory pathway protein FliH
LLYAHQYDSETLQRLFPEPAFIQATATIDRIARIHEDKEMYDAREKQLRDQRWMIKSSLKQGLEQGLEQGRKEGIDLGKLLGQIKSFQKLLGFKQSSDEELMAKEPAELAALASKLENQILTHLQR